MHRLLSALLGREHTADHAYDCNCACCQAGCAHDPDSTPALIERFRVSEVYEDWNRVGTELHLRAIEGDREALAWLIR